MRTLLGYSDASKNRIRNVCPAAYMGVCVCFSILLVFREYLELISQTVMTRECLDRAAWNFPHDMSYW